MTETEIDAAFELLDILHSSSGAGLVGDSESFEDGIKNSEGRLRDHIKDIEKRLRRALYKIDLPRYKCHKKVRAVRIDRIEYGDIDQVILHCDGARVVVEHHWTTHHAIDVGGYYVVEENGDATYSPAEAFEAGYTLIEEDSK